MGLSYIILLTRGYNMNMNRKCKYKHTFLCPEVGRHEYAPEQRRDGHVQRHPVRSGQNGSEDQD